MRQQEKIKTLSLADKWRTEKAEKQRIRKEYEQYKKESQATIKSLSDENGALQSEIHDLSHELKLRQEKDSLIITENNGYITSISKTVAYNERISVSSIEGINLLTVCKTPLYQKIPFLKKNNGIIEIDKQQYNKYKIVGGL